MDRGWQWAEDVEAIIMGFATPGVGGATLPVVAWGLAITGAVFWVAAAFASWTQGLQVRSLVSPSRPFRWDVVAKVFAVSLLLLVGANLLTILLSSSEVRFTGVGTEHVIWLVPMLFVLVIQTTGEDVFFKGWLLHRVGAISGLVWLAPLLVTVVFVSIHVGNPDFDDLWLNAPLFVGSELAIMYLVVRTGGMEAAFVLHFTNNLILLLLFAEEGTGSTDLTLFVSDAQAASGGIVADEVLWAVLYVLHFVGMLTLLVWKRSPFFLEPYVPPVLELEGPVFSSS